MDKKKSDANEDEEDVLTASPIDDMLADEDEDPMEDTSLEIDDEDI